MDGEYSEEVSEASAELHFLIAKFLCEGPCSDIGEALKCELERRKILPKRFDWTGGKHQQNFRELESKYSYLDGEHLLNICQRLGHLVSKNPKNLAKDDGLLRGHGQSSVLQPLNTGVERRSQLYLYSRSFQTPNSCLHNVAKMLFGRENCSQLLKSNIQREELYSRLRLNCRILGHLSAVYCVLFDRKGQYIITGADDLLVKIWEVQSGRLMATLRGASMEITDVDINQENTLLAAGSLDKIVRVWCLQTTAPVAVLTAHSGMITSVRWCPYPETGTFRYLVSSSADGSVAFWTYAYNRFGKNVKFNPKPIQYHERMRPGQAQIICASFSHGGVYLAAASADHHVRVYQMIGDEGPTRIFEKEVHTDRVDSIQWASKGLRFISGSKDGTALIWWYEAREWHHRVLDMQKRLQEPTEEEAKLKLKVSMVAWALHDQYVITAVNDHLLRVWNSTNGNLIHCLKGHKEELFVLERHPICQNLMLSAGHDGQIIIWDIPKGTILKSFQNTIDGQGFGAVYDAKWSPDGSMVAATDSHGHLLIFCLGENDKYKKLPKDMFFHTDYRPLVRDSNHWVLDEQTQMAPHLMPPPFLVDIDGNPYPPIMQRLVPGRSAQKDEQLIPNLVVNEDGDREVQDLVQPARSNIDQMIEQLARQNAGEEPAIQEAEEVDARENAGPSNNDHAYARSPPIQNRALGNVAVRRSGDVEGVRQSSGNWQQGNGCSVWLKKNLVSFPNKHEEAAIIKKSCALGDEEYEEFEKESRKQPVKEKTISPQLPKVKNKSPRKQPPSNRNRNQENANTNNHSYRTRTAVLGEDFVDPSNLSVTSSSSSSDDDSSLDSSDSSGKSSDSSDYSDWVAEKSSDRQATLQPPKRSRRRAVVLRRSSQEDHDDDSNEEEEDHQSENAESPEPGPSKVKRDSRLRQAPKKTVRIEDASPPRTVRNPATAKLLASHIKEVPEQFKPSEWLTETMPRKTPYYPQIGDEVVYFRQGHQQYLNAVRNKKIYDPGAKCEPWLKKELREVEYVKVVGIKYEIKPPRLCCLRLAIMDAETGAFTSYFNIKYHDIPDVIDFLVLRHYYDSAMQNNWKVGEQFRSLIDDSWWIGTIEAQNPADVDFPDSPFQCFQVRWDNGEFERMSPWDLEVVDPDRLPAEKGGSVDVLPEETEASLFKSVDPAAWPPSGESDVECQRLLEIFDQIMALSVAEPFSAPVDLSLYPSYALVIAYPIDLTTIKNRLENRFYRSIQALQFDVRYIASNAETFNQRKSLIVRQANILSELCLLLIRDSDGIDIVNEYHNLANAYKSDSSGDEEDPNEKETGKKKSFRKSPRKKSLPKLQVDPDEWRERCSDLLHTIMNHKDAGPFKEPVDPSEFSDYLQVVPNPMDLSTVRDTLEAGEYQDPTEFCKHMRLIFTNSKNYNTNRKSMVYSMTVRLSSLFESSFQPILNDWKSGSSNSKGVANGSSSRTTRSAVARLSPVKKSASSSSNSSFTRTRSTRSAIVNGVTRRLKISSDSEGSVASTSRDSKSRNAAASSDQSTSTSVPNASSSGPINGNSTRQKIVKIRSSTSDDENDVDVGGSSPSESRPESANFADGVEDDDSSDERDESEADDDSEDHSDDDDDDDYGSRRKAKRPQRAVASRKRHNSDSDSDSAVERPKRSKRDTTTKKPSSSNRNRRQQKVVSYQELSEEEFKPRKSNRSKKRVCIQSDSGGEEEEEEEHQAISVSSRGRIRKLTEKGRSVFD